MLAMPISAFLTVIGILNVPFWMHLSTTPPTPPTPKEKRLRDDFATFMNVSIQLLRSCLWLQAAAESLSVLSSSGTIPSSISEYLLLPGGHSVFVSPLRTTAALFVVAGGILRWRCFREMGAHFTFQVTILEKHKLVTSGPYAYVRHPSYTGAMMINFGLWAWLFLPGSWVTESSIAGSIWFWPVLAPCLVLMVISIPHMLKRCEVEDQILMKQFGQEWETWAKDVPCRLVPGLY